MAHEHDDDTELVTIEGRIAELARTRKQHLAEADALTKGLKGLLASWRGDRDQRIEDAIQTARMCRMEIDRLREVHDQRIAELDPERADEMAQNEERQLLLEHAATVRKMGGPEAELLQKLEGERRARMEHISSIEHVLFVGDHARKALQEYRRRLRLEKAELETDALTARIGKFASVQTACAEARESLVNFIDIVAVADVSMIKIGLSKEIDFLVEAENCTRNIEDIEALMKKSQADLEFARQKLRPIEAGYRNFLAVTTSSAAPERVRGPRR